MSRAISQQEFVDTASDLIEVVGKQTLFIQKDGRTVAAIISFAEYESTHEARAQRAIAAMDSFGEYMSTVTSAEELDDLGKALDARAA